MVTYATGFLASDGTFFKRKKDARAYEAKMKILQWCELNSIDGDKVMTIIEAMAEPIMEYVDASTEPSGEDQPNTQEVEEGTKGVQS